MGIRATFETGLVIGEAPIFHELARNALTPLCDRLIHRARPEEPPTEAWGSTLILAESQTTELDSYWCGVAADPTCATLLLLVGDCSAQRIAALARSGPVVHVADAGEPLRLRLELERARQRNVTLATFARKIVGQGSMPNAVQVLRENMFFEAMQRSRGNRTLAAGLLRVDRRAVQRMAKDYDYPQTPANDEATYQAELDRSLGSGTTAPTIAQAGPPSRRPTAAHT
jgi:hypothetical protein